MVDVLSSTGQDPLRGTKLKQEEEQEDKSLAIQPAPLSPQPDLDKPIKITEDVNYPDDLETLSLEDYNLDSEEYTDLDPDDYNILDDYVIEDSDEELDMILDTDIDEDTGVEDSLVAKAGLTEEDDYKPVSYEEYLKNEDRRNAGIQIGRTSLVKHAWEWMRQAVDEDYVPEDSIKGREASIEILKGQLDSLGDIEMDGSPLSNKQIRQADFIWDNIHRLTELNALDKAAAEAEVPDLGEFVEVLTENPSLIADEMIKEMANKPELFFVAPFAAAKAAGATYKAAQAASLGSKTTRVAKHVGGAAGASAGAFTLGTVDRLLEQSTSEGDTDLLRAAKQSVIDAKLGLVLYGSGKVLSSSMSGAKRVRGQRAVNRKKANDLAGTTEKNLETKLESQKIEEAMQDKATETYVDASGSVYTFEVRDISTYQNRIDRIAELKELKASVTNKEAQKVIQKQITNEEASLTSAKLEGSSPTQVSRPMKSLESDPEATVNGTAAEKWLEAKDPKPVITKNYIDFEDAEGNKIKLRRLTPKLLKSQGIQVQGINSLDLVQPTNIEKATGSFMHVFKDFAISATSALEPLARSSATARLLIDTVNPHAGTRGRSPIETIQETTHSKQAMYSNEIQRLTDGMDEAQSIALTKHMRQVELSEDPKVIQAAEGLRTLIQGSVKYAREGGMKVDYDDNWLPRYYNQESLKSPEAQAKLADAVSGIVDDADIALYSRSDALKSADKIARNIREHSDEGVYVEVGGSIRPIGSRSWTEVPDSQLHDWLGDDVAGDINRYLSNLVKRTEHDKVFGYNGGKIKTWISEIDKDLGDSRILSDKETDGLYDLYDLVSGKYGGKPKGKLGADAALAVTNAIKLPFVTLTSALEPSSMLFKVGMAPAIKGILNSYLLHYPRKLAGSKKLARMREEANSAGITHSAAVKERLDAMVGDGLDGLPAKVNTSVMKGFLLHQWTEHTRVMAYEAANSELLNTIKRIAKDPDLPSDRRWLAEQGVHPDKALEWLDQGADVSAEFYKTIHKGSARLTNTMIANPNKLNKPKWLSSRASIPRLAGAFKSFGAVFNNDVAKSTLDEVSKLWNEGSKLKAMQKAGMLLSVVSAMSYWSAYKFETIGATQGGSAIGDDTPEDVALKMTQGIVGFLIPGGSLTAPMVGSRSMADQVAGPVVGTAESIRKAVVSGDPSKITPIPKALSKMSGGDSKSKY